MWSANNSSRQNIAPNVATGAPYSNNNNSKMLEERMNTENIVNVDWYQQRVMPMLRNINNPPNRQMEISSSYSMRPSSVPQLQPHQRRGQFQQMQSPSMRPRSHFPSNNSAGHEIQSVFETPQDVPQMRTVFRAQPPHQIQPVIQQPSLQMLPPPRPLHNQPGTSTSTNSENGSNKTTTQSGGFKKSNEDREQVGFQNFIEKSCFYTGTIERILKWNRMLKDSFAHYQVIAPIVSIQEGNFRGQRIMLLRDKIGPILQVHYYENTHMDINVDNFCVGQNVRCVGRMTGINIMSAFSIRSPMEDEIETLQRFACISDHAVSQRVSAPN